MISLTALWIGALSCWHSLVVEVIELIALCIRNHCFLANLHEVEMHAQNNAQQHSEAIGSDF